MRKIKITDKDKAVMLKAFEDYIANTKFDVEKISYSTTLEVPKEELKRVNLFITPEAYCKMITLVNIAKDEIGWHGIVERPDDETYIITDIIMYPQEVTSTTVVSNDEKYPVWLMKQPDEVFNNIRMQGHSHVNMGTSPSGVDTNFYNTILQTLNETDYYIFLIMNKRQELWCQIYNLAENAIYEKKDIYIDILASEGVTAAEWYVNETKDNIIEKKYVYTGTNWRDTPPPNTQIKITTTEEREAEAKVIKIKTKTPNSWTTDEKNKYNNYLIEQLAADSMGLSIAAYRKLKKEDRDEIEAMLDGGGV